MKADTIEISGQMYEKYRWAKIASRFLPDYNPLIGYAAWDEVRGKMYLSETHPFQWEYRLLHYAPGQDV